MQNFKFCIKNIMRKIKNIISYIICFSTKYKLQFSKLPGKIIKETNSF